MNMQRNWVSGVLFSLIFIMLLAGCGSGDTAPPPIASISAAEGLWNGTTDDGRAIMGVVLEGGTYWFAYSTDFSPSTTAGAFQGTSSTQNGVITASNGKDFNLENHMILDATMTGSYVNRQSLSGSLDYPTGGHSTFTSTFNSEYDGIPDLSLVVGTYRGSMSILPRQASLITMTVFASGAISGFDTHGCLFQTSLAPRLHGNVYDVTSFAGVPTLQCSPELGSDFLTGVTYFDAATKRLFTAALNSTRTQGFLFIGTQQ